MQIKICPEKVEQSGLELLDCARFLRRRLEEAEHVRAQLQQLTGLEECRAALLRQGERLSREAAGLEALSSALLEAAGLYRTAEARNLDALEERPRFRREAAEGFGVQGRQPGPQADLKHPEYQRQGGR